MNGVYASRVRPGQVRPGQSILTAILVGSTVFSAMTVPLIKQQPVPVLMDFPPQWDQTPPSRMNRETRNSIIRYLGIALVTGVGSGMGAVELLRRQYRSRQRIQQAESQLQEEAMLSDFQYETSAPTYVPFGAGAIESGNLFEVDSFEASPAEVEERVTVQATAAEYSTGYSIESAPSQLVLES